MNESNLEAPMTEEVVKALAEFLATLSPPAEFKRYGREVTDTKGRVWLVVALPPSARAGDTWRVG